MDAVSRLRRSKLAARFAQHDVDGDGFLEESDYQTLARLLGDRLDATPAAREAISAGFADQWRQLCTHADIDGDGRVSLAEYTSAMGAGIAGDADGLDRAVLQTTRAVVQAADSDGDGYLDFPDYERLAALLRVEHAAEGFQLLDADADGRLSHDEITAAVRDFYTSEDPVAPGNFVFGRID